MLDNKSKKNNNQQWVSIDIFSPIGFVILWNIAFRIN